MFVLFCYKQMIKNHEVDKNKKSNSQNDETTKLDKTDILKSLHGVLFFFFFYHFPSKNICVE